jgi:PAS domain S-box-containing protein
MHDQEKTRDQLLVELAALRQQVAGWEMAYDELERRVEERTAELVRVNEELTIFRRFVESSRQGFGMSRLNGEVTYVNPAISRVIADGRPEDVIGKHISAFHSKEYMHRREVEILPSVVREGHWQGEVAISHRGGKVHENRYGLEGIRQRVRLLGGKCSIQSKAGRGARIALELPVVVRE